MFRQFAIARFMIGFIVFILAYMVATLSYDVFFHFITAGLFILSLWIMHEVRKGHEEQLIKNDAAWEEKLQEIQEKLDQKEADVNFLIHSLNALKPEAD